jgi:MFS family permease
MRVLQGIGGSMILTTGVALITSVFPPQERGKALGLNVSAVYIGLSLGPFIGGFLTQSLGWRSIFLAIVPLGLIIIFLISKFLKTEWADAKEEKLDIPGSLIYALTLIALVYGSSLLPRTSGILLMLCGIPGFFLFVKRQLTIPNPVFEIRLFKNNKVFAFSNLAAMINYSGTTAMTFLLSLYLQYIKDMTPQQAGSILIIQPIAMAILSPYAGRLSDKKEPAIISSIGMAGTALGFFILTFLRQDSSISLIVCALIVLGLGFALFSSPNTNAIMGTVERKYYGIASASVSTARLLGQMFSMAIATLVISLFVGKNQITPEYYPMFIQSIHVCFIISFILCTIGIFFSYSRGNVHEKNN